MMAQFLHQLGHVLARASVCSYTFLGTTPGGIAAQILALIATTVKGRWWRVQAWRDNWEAGLKSGLKPLAYIWGLVFIACVVLTIHHDHQNLAGRLRNVVNEREKLKTGLKDRDDYIDRLLRDQKGRPDKPSHLLAASPEMLCRRLEECPSAELRRRAIALAGDIDSLYVDYLKTTQQQVTPENRGLHDAQVRAARIQKSQLYRNKYDADVRGIRAEILKRVGSSSRNPSNDILYESVGPGGGSIWGHRASA
jgi:hypothetical protein